MNFFWISTAGLMIWAGAALAGPTAADVAACGTFPEAGGSLDCSCTGSETGSVWGSGPYTADSNVCVAARHAGAVNAQGGVVSVYAVDGQSAYPGSAQNGVTTSTWGSYGRSFEFARYAATPTLQACGSFPNGQASYSCGCTGAESGTVWGSGPYTSDSDLCVAARHAGALGERGGSITVLGVAGLSQYSASQANGVSTSEWGSYGSSVVFNRN